MNGSAPSEDRSERSHEQSEQRPADSEHESFGGGKAWSTRQGAPLTRRSAWFLTSYTRTGSRDRKGEEHGERRARRTEEEKKHARIGGILTRSVELAARLFARRALPATACLEVAAFARHIEEGGLRISGRRVRSSLAWISSARYQAALRPADRTARAIAPSARSTRYRAVPVGPPRAGCRSPGTSNRRSEDPRRRRPRFRRQTPADGRYTASPGAM